MIVLWMSTDYYFIHLHQSTPPVLRRGFCSHSEVSLAAQALSFSCIHFTVVAEHRRRSSKCPKPGPNEPERVYGGNPAGFVIIIKNCPTIYHSGDTASFKDMETIGETYSIDIALLNIGGHFGMEPRNAIRMRLA